MADSDDKQIARALMGLIDTMAENKVKERQWDGERIAQRAELLTTLCERYQEYYVFKPGDIVRWKADMKNKKRPAYHEPAVVVEVLYDPVMDLKDSGSAYFREKLDLVLGLVDDDGDFILFHFDSRRFEPLPTPPDDL